MNKTIIGLILGLGVSWTALAETGQPADATPASQAAPPQQEAGKHHGIKLKELSEELGLSEAHEAKLKSLFKKHKRQLKQIREENKGEIQATLQSDHELKLPQNKKKNREKIKALKEALKDADIKP
jgi:Spy/CpxP family protein refolding chaperone